MFLECIPLSSLSMDTYGIQAWFLLQSVFPTAEHICVSAGSFTRLISLHDALRVRIVLVNRRDYPGATVYDEAEMAQLRAATSNTQEGADLMRAWFRGRSLELYNFLEDYIQREKVTKEGGLIIAGWSLGAAFLNGLLAYAPTFRVGEVDVASYIKYAIAYGA